MYMRLTTSPLLFRESRHSRGGSRKLKINNNMTDFLISDVFSNKVGNNIGNNNMTDLLIPDDFSNEVGKLIQQTDQEGAQES